MIRIIVSCGSIIIQNVVLLQETTCCSQKTRQELTVSFNLEHKTPKEEAQAFNSVLSNTLDCSGG